MKKQTISESEIISYLSEKGNDEITCASDLPLKKITATIYGDYRVYKNGVLHHRTRYVDIAVQEYNEI